MKLQNKKTGKIIDSDDLLTDKFILDLFSKDFKYFTSKLNKICEEWEDYEEPKDKGYWYIDDLCRMRYSSELLDEIDDRSNNWMIRKLCGNYFSSREEAEQAVEKLKAWKRLKDKGFKFVGVRGIGKVIDFDIPKPYHHVAFDEYNANEDELEFFNDLMLLFGGEE